MARTDWFFGKGSRTGSLNWPDPDLGPWKVQIAWREVRGVPTPVGMMMGLMRGVSAAEEEREGDPHKIDGGLLRQLPFARLAEQTRRQLISSNREATKWWLDAADRADEDERDVPRTEAEAAERFAQALDVPVAPRVLGIEHFRRVAQIYRANAHPGGKPTKAVQEALVISKSAAAKQVARARELGVLEPSSGKGKKS